MYNTYCFSTTTMVTRKRLIVTLYVYCLSSYKMQFYVKRNGTPKRAKTDMWLLVNATVQCNLVTET